MGGATAMAAAKAKTCVQKISFVTIFVCVLVFGHPVAHHGGFCYSFQQQKRWRKLQHGRSGFSGFPAPKAW
jgi:hypothetical protein